MLRPVLFCCFTFLVFLSHAQEPARSSYFSLAEKIYVQTDNKVYTTDQAIWFKAIVVEAADHKPGTLSGVLYVELIDPHENIVERKLVKLKEGTGDGFFQLSANYSHGIYLLRAYTEWNRNFGEMFFFKEYIRIDGAETGRNNSPIKAISIIEDASKNRRMRVQLDENAVDSFEAKDIRFVINNGTNKDTLLMKKNRSNQYLLAYTIPPKSEILNLQVQSNNQLNYSKTIVVDTGYTDLLFFPESGELVQGLPVVLGFKAVDYKGNGRMVEGDIIDKNGGVVTHFKSNELGMGIARWEQADSAAGYKARIFPGIITQTDAMPAISGRGTILSARKNGDSILLKVLSNYLVNDSIVVRASCRGIAYYDFKAGLKKGFFQFSLPAHLLPEGVIDFTVLLEGATPIAERLFFNEQPASRLNIALAADKNEYNQREKTVVTVEAKDQQGVPVQANLSALVVNKGQNTAAGIHQNILSYFLLSSDLRGEIEKPALYFGKDENRSSWLDALLLTQGWRKYNYQREPVVLKYLPESGLTVAGGVKGGLFNKKKMQGAELTLMTFGKEPYVDTQKTDSLGKFQFVLRDEYGENDMNILIQSANKSSKKQNYVVALDPREFPPVVFDQRQAVEKPDSLVLAYVESNIRRKKIEDSIRIAAEGKTLQEVIVKSRILSPQQKLVTEKYGDANVIINGQAIRDKEAKWSYGLYSVLLFNFPDEVSILRVRGDLYAIVNREWTLVVIDGIPVRREQYPFIPSIPPSEVKSFEIIRNAKNFRNLFCEYYPEGCTDPGAPTYGNVIAIYSFAGKGLNSIRPTIGMNKMNVPVFAPTREFYAPKYDQLKEADWTKPDLRNLIHWQPLLQTDSSGKTQFSFYNADIPARVQVVVEAITESGEIGYREFYFDVRKKTP